MTRFVIVMTVFPLTALLAGVGVARRREWGRVACLLLFPVLLGLAAVRWLESDLPSATLPLLIGIVATLNVVTWIWLTTVRAKRMFAKDAATPIPNADWGTAASRLFVVGASLGLTIWVAAVYVEKAGSPAANVAPSPIIARPTPARSDAPGGLDWRSVETPGGMLEQLAPQQ